jgi:hypothetical protein
MQRGLNITHYLYATFYTMPSYSTRCTCSGASRLNLHASWNSLQKRCCMVFAIVQYWLADTATINLTEEAEDTRCSALIGPWLWEKKKRGERKSGTLTGRKNMDSTNDVLNHGASSIRFRILQFLPFLQRRYSCEWHPDGGRSEEMNAIRQDSRTVN